MPSAVNMITNLEYLLDKRGQVSVIRYYYSSGTSTDYDDFPAIAASGTTSYLSGTVLVQNLEGEDLKLVEAGILEFNDKKLVIMPNSDINEMSEVDIGTSGNTFIVTNIMPVINEGATIYQNVFVRRKK